MKSKLIDPIIMLILCSIFASEKHLSRNPSDNFFEGYWIPNSLGGFAVKVMYFPVTGCLNTNVPA